jgi:AraC-like DNA-binding protein
MQHIDIYMDTELSLRKLSDVSCVSSDHLTRIFKRELGCTPVRYINQKKIEKAQLLLATTRKSITDIALELSFGNANYFSRLFKKHTGFSPSEYSTQQKFR